MLSVERLTVRYPTRRLPALRGVDLAVRPGDRLLIAGASGSGKSTLGLCLAGLVPNSLEAEMSGEVLVDGRPTRAYGPGGLADQVGVVFQDPGSQFTMLSVQDEVAFGLENLAVPGQEIGPRVQAALAWVGLADRAAWRIDRLSGGQQQRVALAAALAMRPGLLVLDEPTAHLDAANADLVFEALESLASMGTTLVLVEHDLDRAAPLTRSALLLGRDGIPRAHGLVQELLTSPEHAETWCAEGVYLPTPTRLALAARRSIRPDTGVNISLGRSFGGGEPAAHGASQNDNGRAADNHVQCRPLPRGQDAEEQRLPLTVGDATRWVASAPAVQAWLRSAGSVPRGITGEPVLHARGVSVRYRWPSGAFQALADASLEVRAGEVVALVGASGSGKSTLLRACTGLVPLERGSIQVAGNDLARADARTIAGLVGLVFQSPEAGFVRDHVEAEMAFGPRRLGWSEDRVEAHVRAGLERFGLDTLRRANPYTLSEGQKRRLSVASALVLGPRLLLLDEPTFGQDRASAAALLAEIDRLARDGMAVLIATHDLGLALEWADRVVALEVGRVIFDSEPAELAASGTTLRRAGQVLPTLERILAEARRLGADVPPTVRWSALEQAAAPVRVPVPTR